MPLFFHTEDHNYSLPDKDLIELWIVELIKIEKRELGIINIIFTSNDYLLKINQEYLNHHYNTDVITFNYNVETVISGDIFVSVDQVRINAKRFSTVFNNEINRVMIHGVLHLIGYDDKDEKSQMEMTRMENQSLTLLEEITNGKNI